MQSIFVIGAGRSSSSLISYLLTHASFENWRVKVGDVSLELAQQKIAGHEKGEAIAFDMNDEAQRHKEIQGADLVISMLPANLHGKVAQDCVRFKKNLVTASYVSDEMKTLDEAAKEAGILLLNEIGLDPGIDHLSAMKIIDAAKAAGEEITLFKSYCGGLVAPESNDNPWGYKFSWNPRNVILAGQATAQYKENGEYKYIPYNRLFTQTESITVEGIGSFDGYANRDSLSYRAPYGIENIPTILRGTLRMTGYCKAWNVFVKLGLTDDTYKIERANEMTYRALIESYLPFGKKSTKEKLIEFMGADFDAAVLEKLEWLGIFDETKIELPNGTPAQILQHLLENKWLLKPDDKDMIVMQHQFETRNTSARKVRKIYSTLVVKGDDNVHTAMAKTVGLPMAIAARKILKGEIKLTGVRIPVMKEIYEPVLQELQELGIRFGKEASKG
ncbi:MAG: saccharopine dehydrogenase NADP-binding domain-containing protein [Bacteroidetes bacterium]|nr:saccharopine dehydrogenase NADP-binding domain-containing protein [Bacteroidota bacterium]